MPGKPFLTPAYHNGAQRSLQAMIARGQQRLPELLAGVVTEVTE